MEIFLATLVIPLQGAKRLLRQRGSEHRFPAYTLTLAREHGVEAGTKIGTFEPRRNGTMWLEGTNMPRKFSE